jgi:DNA-binding transcriptional ArsR family regulator
MSASQRAAQLAQALADPLRLTLLRHLMGGSATVAELVVATGASQSKVSNHLALLRAQNLVRAERQGRQMRYHIADPTVAQLVEALTVLAGEPPKLARPVEPLAEARTCYDHLAGSLGVALFDRLVASDALIPPSTDDQPVKLGPSGEVRLGPNADAIFGRLGIDVSAVAAHRRQFAYACRDWTERRFHLGGALGAALCQRFLDQHWVEPGKTRRQLQLTDAGREALHERLGMIIRTVE